MNRVHLSLHCTNLARSAHFYATLLGTEPSTTNAESAEFVLTDPPLALSLHVGLVGPGALNHAGLRLPNAAGLVAVQRRLEEAGIRTQRQEGVACCYALQTKFWVTDPDQVLWEVYTKHDDLPYSGFDAPPAPTPTPALATWQQRLGEPVPTRLPFADNTLDLVQLDGTLNGLPHTPSGTLLREVQRVLRPGGQVRLRCWASLHPVNHLPAIPGLRGVLLLHEMEQLLLHSGCVGLTYEQHTPLDTGGYDVQVQAWKPVVSHLSAAVYRGPFAQVSDDAGQTYHRGQLQLLSPGQASAVQAGPSATQVVILPPPG
jgi:catechol 2,3-dioxygenase-like lactoylglutathione lyase family enzyme